MLGSDSTQARRACCTSWRSCSLACRVFFERKIPFVQLMAFPISVDDFRLITPVDRYRLRIFCKRSCWAATSETVASTLPSRPCAWSM